MSSPDALPDKLADSRPAYYLLATFHETTGGVN